MLSQIEIVLRRCDRCVGCATHTLPGPPPVQVRVFDQDHQMLKEVFR